MRLDIEELKDELSMIQMTQTSAVEIGGIRHRLL